MHHYGRFGVIRKTKGNIWMWNCKKPGWQWDLATAILGVLILHPGLGNRFKDWENAIYRNLPYHLERRRLARRYSKELMEMELR